MKSAQEQLLDWLISEDGLDFSACSTTAFDRALRILERFDIQPIEEELPSEHEGQPLELPNPEAGKHAPNPSDHRVAIIENWNARKA